MRIIVIGGRGFIGAAFVRLLSQIGHEVVVIGRENWALAEGTACDVLIYAAGNSRKYLAERDPRSDFDANVRDLYRALETVRAPHFVLISSADVYPDQSSPALTPEALVIDPALCSRYGLHKHLAEQLLMGAHSAWLIVRMGGVVGPGLWKNAIFDMLNDQPVRLDPESELQFIGVDTAARIIWNLVRGGIVNQVVNLGAHQPVHLGRLHRRLGSASPFLARAPRIRYEVSLAKIEMLAAARMPNGGDEVEAYLQSIGR